MRLHTAAQRAEPLVGRRVTPAASNRLHPAARRPPPADSPVNLSIFVEVLQPLQDLLQDGGDAGLVQHPGLVLATGDDVLDDVQDGACKIEARQQPRTPDRQRNSSEASGEQDAGKEQRELKTKVTTDYFISINTTKHGPRMQRTFTTIVM